ncbi:type II secretion system protein [Vibrio astriarenae]
MNKENGFTLVELIVVILLVAIVSTYAASRYLGKSSFSAYTYQEAVISVIRQVQVNRMQSNIEKPELNDYFKLVVTNQCLGSKYACEHLSDNRSDVVILEEPLTFDKFQNVEFDLLGKPLVGPVVIELRDSGLMVTQICINAQGYVSSGVCS